MGIESDTPSVFTIISAFILNTICHYHNTTLRGGEQEREAIQTAAVIPDNHNIVENYDSVPSHRIDIGEIVTNPPMPKYSVPYEVIVGRQVLFKYIEEVQKMHYIWCTFKSSN